MKREGVKSERKRVREEGLTSPVISAEERGGEKKSE